MKGLRAIKEGPFLVTEPSVPLTGPSVPLTGPRFPLWGRIVGHSPRGFDCTGSWGAPKSMGLGRTQNMIANLCVLRIIQGKSPYPRDV